MPKKKKATWIDAPPVKRNSADIKVLQTAAYGCRFRSRLEARWAVVLTEAGIQWEYEPEGFQLRFGPYLPDFWLPVLEMWVEIKPFKLDRSDCWSAWDRLNELVVGTQCGALLLCGAPGDIESHLGMLIGKSLGTDTDSLASMLYKDLSPDCRQLIDSCRMDQRGAGVSLPTASLFPSYAIKSARSARFEHGETPVARSSAAGKMT